MADDATSVLSKQIEEIGKAGGNLTQEALRQLAKPITSAFDVKMDELAILRLSDDGKVLSFLYPVRMQKVGAIPLTLTHSLAAKTIREKRGEVVNTFVGYKHPTVFEAVKLSDEQKAAPIQKIMSAPLMADGNVVGVIQVCRKWKHGGEPGADFTSANLTELSRLGNVLGRFLATLPAPSPLPHQAKPAKT